MTLVELHRPSQRRRKEAPPEAGGALRIIIDNLAAKDRLTDLQLAAACQFLSDLEAYHGSTGMGSGYGERVDTSVTAGKLSRWTSAHIRCQAVLDRLFWSQRELLNWLILARDKQRGDLVSLGRRISGYEDRTAASAAAVTAIRLLLNCIAEIYFPQKVPKAA